MISNSVLDKLEFNKILQYISRYNITEKGKNIILTSSPMDDENAVIREGKLVSDAKNVLIHNDPPPIEFLPDLGEVISKSTIEGSVLEAKRILDVLRLAVISRNLFQYFKSTRELAPELSKLSEGLFVDKVFEHHISRVINESGEVKDNASPTLVKIRNEINTRKDELVKVVNRIVKNLNDKDIVREDYLTLRDGRIVIPVKVEHKKHIKGFIHSESSTGQTVYIEPQETLDLNNEIITLSFAEKREIERLLRELTKLIGSSSSPLRFSLDLISYVDSIFAKAKYSIEIIGCFPETDRNKPFYLKDARHPIILKKLGREKTIPLSLNVDGNKVIIITGPNAGGKTVVLKTLGLLSLMIKTGIHIPADPDSNVYLFKKILVDIGDEQSIEDDLSTFSSHLSNINRILNNADDNSLVLLDEIGTGTDPAEGSALATAVLFTLKEKGAVVLASTHHGSLKLIANDTNGMENAAMEFDTENLRPTYFFKQGIPGSSYAFEVAGRIGFDKNFLNLAEEFLDTDKHKVENFLVDLETKSKKLQDKLNDTERENARLTGLTGLYQKNVEKLEKEKRDILKKAKHDAEEYLQDVNKKIEKAIKEIKESNANEQIIKNARKSVQDLKEENKKVIKEEPQIFEERELVAGDYVKIRNTETSGEIAEISKDKKKATVNTGKIKMQVKLTDLQLTKKEKNKVESSGLYDYNTGGASFRIDIRGEKPESAEFDVVKFIDNAYTSGLERVEILHGKGTGVLKKLVNEILKKHDKVKNIYFAPVEFGGDGITIAELK